MKSIDLNCAYTCMARSHAKKTYSASQYLVRFPLFLITSFSCAFIDPIKLLIVSIRIEKIVLYVCMYV